MNIQDYNSKVWPFYLRLENEFINSLNYIEFAEDNYLAYSIEFEKQLLSICSEIDVLCKLLCKEVDSTQSPKSFPAYARILCNLKSFSETKVMFLRSKREYEPFDKLNPDKAPTWWQAYNKIKHEKKHRGRFCVLTQK